jgi:hypothetical protein
MLHFGRNRLESGVSLCFWKNSVVALDALLGVDFFGRLAQTGPIWLSSDIEYFI